MATAAVVIGLLVTQSSAYAQTLMSGYLGGLDHTKGYCESGEQEKMLWTAINQLARSFLAISPQIPPEQRNYLMTELNSGGERMVRVLQDPLFKMLTVRDGAEKLGRISQIYLNAPPNLSFIKRVELIGRAFQAIDVGSELERSHATLRSKGYHINPTILMDWQFQTTFLRIHLIDHLICYGTSGAR